ncbi:MAG: hypothetical protein ACRECH_07270, partial [Nitrososphaerales archaeon]
FTAQMSPYGKLTVYFDSEANMRKAKPKIETILGKKLDFEKTILRDPNSYWGPNIKFSADGVLSGTTEITGKYVGPATTEASKERSI